MPVWLGNGKLKDLERALDSALSYEEWKSLAVEHDKHSGRAHWRNVDKTSLYDYTSIRGRLDRLRHLREAGDDIGLLFTLNEGIHGNMGGMGRSILYRKAKFGTKHLIEDYVAEIADALDHLANTDTPSVSFEEKLDFFRRASTCYGKSALMLSGGGALGHFHIGVIKALKDQDLLPEVISGSSAGSVVAGILGTRTDDELRDFLNPEFLVEEAISEAALLNKRRDAKPRINAKALQEKIASLIPDLTFQEAYERTGRHINISVSPADVHQTSRLLNAVASPNVYVRRAVLASCAVPGVYPPVMLEAKNVHGETQPYLSSRRWLDGSVSDDLPAKRLSRMYGVNHFIVSQTNPLVLWALSEDKSHHGILPSLREVGHFGVKQVSRAGTNFARRYLKNVPRFQRAANMFYSIINQEYTGDINIIPRYRFFDPRVLLSEVTEQELLFFVREGELSTWPKIEEIRTCTRISRKLAEILSSYEEEEMRRLVSKRKWGHRLAQGLRGERQAAG